VNWLRLFGRGIGMLAGGITAMLWISIIWFPIEGFMLEGYGVAFGAVMAIIGIVVAIAAFHGHTTVMFFGFVTSFFGTGAFALNVQNWFRAFGILDLFMLLASVMIWASTRKGREES
jgi:hypothetical protein